MAETKQLGVVLLVAAAGLAFWQFGDKDSDDSHQVDERITTVQLAADTADITINVSDDDKTTVRAGRRPERLAQHRCPHRERRHRPPHQVTRRRRTDPAGLAAGTDGVPGGAQDTRC